MLREHPGEGLCGAKRTKRSTSEPRPGATVGRDSLIWETSESSLRGRDPWQRNYVWPAPVSPATGRVERAPVRVQAPEQRRRRCNQVKIQKRLSVHTVGAFRTPEAHRQDG